MPITTLKEAKAIAGTLSKTTKMPGYSYGLPIRTCKTGGILRPIKNSVCSKCYAGRWRYRYPNVLVAQEYRVTALSHPQWVEAMTFMINHYKCEYFRWHDSGDLQGLQHLINIVHIGTLCAHVKFWLPTREKEIVAQYTRVAKIPSNLVIRISAAMIDHQLSSDYANTSSVVTEVTSATCPASIEHSSCGTCRACWDRNIRNIAYLEH